MSSENWEWEEDKLAQIKRWIHNSDITVEKAFKMMD